MAKFRIPLYDLQKPSENCFDLFGYFPASTDQRQLYYAVRHEPNRDIATSIPLGNIGNLSQSITSRTQRIVSGNNNTGTLRTLILPLDGRAFLHEYNSSLNPIEFTRVGGIRDNQFNNIQYYSFIYNGVLHLLSSENRIYSFGGGVGSDAEVVTTNLQEQLNTLNITSEPSLVSVWQNRVFIAYENTLVWCSINNIGEWRPSFPDPNDTTRTVFTLAGFQRFNESNEILGVESHGAYQYIFLDNQVFTTQILDINLQFGYNPQNVDLDYLGGGIATRFGLFFFAHDGIYLYAGEELRKVSEAIDPRLINIRGTEITAIINGDDIFWAFNDLDFMVAYNLIHKTINIVEFASLGVGEIVLDVDTLAEELRPLNTIYDQLGELGGDVQRQRVSYNINRQRLTLEIRRFALPSRPHIRFNFNNTSGYNRTMIHDISVPELTQYNIRIKDKESLDWGRYFTPDRRGITQIRRAYTSPDIEISTITNQNVMQLDINAVSRGR